jgi:hypothetical protein
MPVNQDSRRAAAAPSRRRVNAGFGLKSGRISVGINAAREEILYLLPE